MDLIIRAAPLLLLLAVAFGSGYGIREYIARRRRAAARKKFYDEHAELCKRMMWSHERQTEQTTQHPQPYKAAAHHIGIVAPIPGG
jgi:hypothetical protein